MFIYSPENSILLGAPLLCGTALDAALSHRRSELVTAENRLSLISAHDALLLLKSSLSTPKLLHLLLTYGRRRVRATPRLVPLTMSFDGVFRTSPIVTSQTLSGHRRLFQSSRVV